MIEIKLNSIEQKIVEYIGKARYVSARGKGFDDKQIGDQDKIGIDIDGFGGELAFCKAFNIMPSFIIGETDKEDCVASDGTRVDVKTTRYKTGSLLAPITKKVDDVDVYFLVVKLSEEIFNVIGWQDSKNVICEDAYDRHQNDSRFNGEGYCVYQEDLYEV